MAEPHPDDVIVRERRSNPRTLYAVGTRSSPDQFLANTRDEAIEHAKSYARRARVEAWVQSSDGTFTRVRDLQK